jgi:hypothetical protein
MAYEENLTTNRRTILAKADLSAKQYYAVSAVDATGMDVATAAKACDGILQDNPVLGKAGCVAYAGVTKAAISASQATTANLTQLEVDTGGTLKPVASGIVVAKALETLGSSTGVKIIAVYLEPSNALQA